MTDAIIETMARAIERERWRIAIEQVKGARISSPEGSARTAQAAFDALIEGGYVVVRKEDQGSSVAESGGTASPKSDGLNSTGDAEHLLRIRDRQIATMRKFWVRDAEAALAILPGASNSTHPAHDLWLRVEMAKAPPMEIVLSAEGEN